MSNCLITDPWGFEKDLEQLLHVERNSGPQFSPSFVRICSTHPSNTHAYSIMLIIFIPYSMLNFTYLY